MGSTIRVDESVQIDKPQAAVWDAITDSGGMRLLRPILGAKVRSGLKKDLQKLKAILESPDASAGDERQPAAADARS